MMSEQIIEWDPFSGEEPALGDAVVAIGIFDGLHVGHRALLSEARAKAAELGCGLVTATFDRDPDEVFRAGDPSFGKLLSNGRRLEMLRDFTGATVLSLPTTQEMFQVEPRAFLDLLGSVCTPKAIYVGRDFRFGHRASGDVSDIDAWGAEHGCVCVPHLLVEDLGHTVTATRIRGLLREGRVSEARELLGGRPHSVTGRVVHGRGEGTEFGFATANLDLSDNTVMVPREGVYGGYGVVDGKRYAAAINMGVAKSFAAATAPIEAHLLDFEGDLYGRQVTIEFVQWLRESRVFDSQDELIATVTDNINWVRANMLDTNVTKRVTHFVTSEGEHGAD